MESCIGFGFASVQVWALMSAAMPRGEDECRGGAWTRPSGEPGELSFGILHYLYSWMDTTRADVKLHLKSNLGS